MLYVQAKERLGVFFSPLFLFFVVKYIIYLVRLFFLVVK